MARHNNGVRLVLTDWVRFRRALIVHKGQEVYGRTLEITVF